VNYTRNALDFIHQNADHPFFLYLSYSMPHLPVRTTETFRGKSQAGLYGDVIQTIDWSVGQILTTLRQLELEENTLVIFTSDNGPWLNLPDRMLQKGNERWHSGTPGLLRGAKGTTYEGGMRVPAIVRWPGQIPAATVSGELITSIDIFPTLAAVADAKIPEDYDLDGFNMLPFLKGEKQSPRQDFYYFFTGICEGVRQGAWKYRYSPVNQFRKKRPQGPVKELFHLERDPSERFNVADRYPEKVKDLDFKMRAMVERWGATVHPK
jgi:arylsulfatase A-like enzyme